MSSIKQEIQIAAPQGAVYTALSTQAGYRGWWNAVGEVSERVGGEAQLKFVKDGTPVNMQFRIDALQPNEAVRWTCTAHDMPSWVGTTLDWKLSQQGDTVLVSFEHAGWQEAAGSRRPGLETLPGQPKAVRRDRYGATLVTRGRRCPH
jgi:uncharacterized protein YndB with AHSA1/START domain